MRILACMIAAATIATGAVAQAPAKLTTGSTVKQLMANPATAAVLKADIPQIVNNPQIEMGMDMALSSIAQFEPEALSAANLKKIDADLAAAQP